MWISATFVAFASWVMGFYVVGLNIYFYNHDYERTQHVEDMKEWRAQQGTIYSVFYIYLSVKCVVSYVVLTLTMRKHFGKSLQ